MPDRTNGAARWVMCALIFVAGFAQAGGDEPAKGRAADSERAVPPALAQYLERMQMEMAFRQCVDSAVQKQKLDDNALIERVAAKGLAPGLYSEISKEVDDPDALLRDDGFVAAHADPNELLAEKSLVLATAAIKNRAEAGDPLPSFRSLNLWLAAVNDAVDARCAVPKHLQPGGDALRAQAEAAMPFMSEAERVNGCVKAQMDARGLDEDGAYALIDENGLGRDFRADVLAIASALAPQERDELAKARTPAHLGRGLMLLSATTFDLGVMAKSSGVNAIYLDRALDAKCAPNEELKTFIGVANRANH